MLLTASLNAEVKQQSFHANPVIVTDTLKENALNKQAIDPKQGFKDLFVSSRQENGINTEQLNPMAISLGMPSRSSEAAIAIARRRGVPSGN